MPPGNLFRLKAGSLFAGSVKREEELERKESLWHLFAKSLGGHRTRTRKTITDYKDEYKIAFNAQPMKDLFCFQFNNMLAIAGTLGISIFFAAGGTKYHLSIDMIG